MRDDRRYACRRGTTRRIQHQQQFDQMILHGGAERLDEEHILLAAIGLQLHFQAVIGKALDGRRLQRDTQLHADFPRQLRMRTACEHGNRVHGASSAFSGGACPYPMAPHRATVGSPHDTRPRPSRERISVRTPRVRSLRRPERFIGRNCRHVDNAAAGDRRCQDMRRRLHAHQDWADSEAVVHLLEQGHGEVGSIKVWEHQ